MTTLKTFLQNKYGASDDKKRKKADLQSSFEESDVALSSLILKIQTDPERSEDEAQALALFRKALRELRKGRRYLR
jgi:hypothetical protein